VIKALRQRHPAHRVLLTHTTPTGRQTGVELFGDGVSRCYIPYDFPFAVKRFLCRFRPQVGIVMETEIWPNLIEHCHRRSIPVYLVNARMSEKSARGYARFRSLAGAALRKLAGIGAQTERDAARLADLGAGAVTVTGNTVRSHGTAGNAGAGDAVSRAVRGRKVFLAASTREGEEALILDALAGVDMAELLVVIVRGIRSVSTKSLPCSDSAATPSCAAVKTGRSGRTFVSCSAIRWVKCSPTIARATWLSSAAASCRSAARTCWRHARSAAPLLSDRTLSTLRRLPKAQSRPVRRSGLRTRRRWPRPSRRCFAIPESAKRWQRRADASLKCIAAQLNGQWRF
jgi:hypothetical protein